MSSIIAIGGLHFGSLVNQREVSQLISIGIDHGIDLIDSAPMYGHTESEKLIGKSIYKMYNPPRIATKVGLVPSLDENGHFGVKIDPLTKINIDNSVNQSLKNLGGKSKLKSLRSMHMIKVHLWKLLWMRLTS